MTPTQKSKWYMTIVVLAAGCTIGLIVYLAGLEVDRPRFNTSIPTPTELQEMLVAEGYDLEVDGKIGKKTLAAWEEYSCNKYATLEFRRVSK